MQPTFRQVPPSAGASPALLTPASTQAGLQTRWAGPGGGRAAASGYGIMPQAQPQAQTGAQPSGDDVADAMSALPEDLRRHLGL